MSGLVSMVVPVYNERDNLPELIRRCLAVGEKLGSPYELVLVDDGSRDGSAGIIEAMAAQHPDHVAGVFLNRNYGQHAAVFAGLSEARGDVVVTLDADLQNPPEEIPKLLASIEAGHDVAAGVRETRNDSWFRVRSSRAMNALMRRLTGIEVADYGCMLRAYRRDIVDIMLQCRERTAYIPALANAFAASPSEVIVGHAERAAGRSKYDALALFNLYFDLLITTTTKPMRLMSIFGAAFAVIGALAGISLLVLRVIYGAQWAADGVLTVFAGIFLMLGVQLLALGVVGEYVGRISRDVQGRPRYVISRVMRHESLEQPAPVASLKDVSR
jgi:undecaprenyl-phosphate 4-deoxy-4-formamido-L-arabinose transferase